MYNLTSTYFFRIMFKNGLTKAVYHFIFDRLRSIRQDLIVQGNPDIAKSLQILQICVRFHLMASYKLSNEETEVGGSEIVFDKDFNFTQLLECLKDLLVLYQIKPLEEDSNHILHGVPLKSEFTYLRIFFN